MSTREHASPPPRSPGPGADGRARTPVPLASDARGAVWRSARRRGSRRNVLLTLCTLLLMGCSALLTGCSVLLSADPQCETDAQCTDRGFDNAVCSVDQVCVEAVVEATGPWRCKDSVEWVEEDTTMPSTVGINVVTLIGQTPLVGLEVFSCPPFDPNCDNPIGSTASNDDGVVTFEVYAGFRGHFYAPPSMAFPDIAPTLLFMYPPPAAGNNETADGNVNVTSIDEIKNIAMLEDITIVDGLGHLFYTSLDCDGERASGVSTNAGTVDPETVNIYISEGGLPSAALSATTDRGEGAILNLPPGYVNITGVSEDVGKVFEQTVLIAPDTITGVPIVATP